MDYELIMMHTNKRKKREKQTNITLEDFQEGVSNIFAFILEVWREPYSVCHSYMTLSYINDTV